MPTDKIQVAANLDKQEYAEAVEKANAENLSLGNYIRVHAFDLEPLKTGRPKNSER